jgi:hypothetical protein
LGGSPEAAGADPEPTQEQMLGEHQLGTSEYGGSAEGETDSAPAVDSIAIEAKLVHEPSSQTQHFFVHVDAHPDVDDEAWDWTLRCPSHNL